MSAAVVNLGFPAAILVAMLALAFRLSPDIKGWISRSSELREETLRQGARQDTMMQELTRVVEANTKQLAANENAQNRMLDAIAEHALEDTRDHTAIERAVNSLCKKQERANTDVAIIKSKIV